MKSEPRTYEVRVMDDEIASAIEPYLKERYKTLKRARKVKRALNLIFNGVDGLEVDNPAVEILIYSWKTNTWARVVT